MCVFWPISIALKMVINSVVSSIKNGSLDLYFLFNICINFSVSCCLNRARLVFGQFRPFFFCDCDAIGSVEWRSLAHPITMKSNRLKMLAYLLIDE